MSRTHALAAAVAPFDDGRFFADLQRRIAFRTESDTGAATPALGAYLREELAPALAALGFDCEEIANPVPGGGPFLIARRVEDPTLPTVLSYGHGDVVSGQDAHWREGLSPWTLIAEGIAGMAAAPPTTRDSTASTSRHWRRCLPCARGGSATT